MLTIPQPDIGRLVESMSVGSRFIAQYPDGRFSLFSVSRRRGTGFECSIINGAHRATFDALGHCRKYKMQIVYVRPTGTYCPYTVRDYDTGLGLFTEHYKEAQNGTHKDQ